MSEVTHLLNAAAAGDRNAAADLLPLVYDELRKLAAARMAQESPGHTLDPTALVHEAFLKLGADRSFATRTDYLRAAAEAMRRILVDHARARNAAKRAGGHRVNLEVRIDDRPLSTQTVSEAERADVAFRFEPGNHTVQVFRNHQRLFAEPIRLIVNETVVIEARPDLLSWRSHEERSPFDAVRWRDDTPEIELDGTWYELLSLDGVSVDRLVAKCKGDDPSHWRQRFVEDLVAVLGRLDHKPGEYVRLELRDLSTNATLARGAAMTVDKRRALRQARLARQPAAAGVSQDRTG
jgi:RNA polymerase sigma factor (TIGR02999 family)